MVTDRGIWMNAVNAYRTAKRDHADAVAQFELAWRANASDLAGALARLEDTFRTLKAMGGLAIPSDPSVHAELSDETNRMKRLRLMAREGYRPPPEPEFEDDEDTGDWDEAVQILDVFRTSIKLLEEAARAKRFERIDEVKEIALNFMGPLQRLSGEGRLSGSQLSEVAIVLTRFSRQCEATRAAHEAYQIEQINAMLREERQHTKARDRHDVDDDAHDEEDPARTGTGHSPEQIVRAITPHQDNNFAATVIAAVICAVLTVTIHQPVTVAPWTFVFLFLVIGGCIIFALRYFSRLENIKRERADLIPYLQPTADDRKNARKLCAVLGFVYLRTYTMNIGAGVLPPDVPILFGAIAVGVCLYKCLPIAMMGTRLRHGKGGR